MHVSLAVMRISL